MWLREKTSKAQMDYLVPIKSTTTTEGEKKGGEIQKNLQNKSKNKNDKCSSWVTAVTVHFIPLGCPPTLCWSLDLLWGSSDSNLVLFLCVLASNVQFSELVHFLLWELSMAFYIFHRHRVCLVDHVDLIWSLYSW